MFTSRVSVISSLWLVFLVNGTVLASWAPRIPEVKDRIGLSDGELGIALLGIALGAVPAMLLTARVLRRASDLLVCAPAAVLFPAALPLIDIASSLLGLTAVLMLLGAVSGALDVAMNAVAVRLQAVWRLRILGRLHGAYSLGVLAGTSGAAIATHAAGSVGAHFVIVSIVLVTAALSAASVLLAGAPPARMPSRRPEAPVRGTSRVLASGPRIAAGVTAIAIGGFLLEGIVTDWSVLLLRRDLSADPTLAASVLSMFSVAMFVSRSLSDVILQRMKERAFLLVAALLIAVSIPAGVLARSVPLLVAGVVVTGLCVGPLFPLALARGGRAAPSDVAGVTARLSVVGYAAYLGGPPLIGFGAERMSLPTTFVTVVLATGITLTVTATIAARRRVEPDTTPRDGTGTDDDDS